MARTLVLISQRREDFVFADLVANRLNLNLKQCNNREAAVLKLTEDPKAIIFWNADTNSTAESVIDILGKYANGRQIFAITENSLDHYPQVFKSPWFRNHLIRHFEVRGQKLLPIIIAAALSEGPLGVDAFFPAGAQEAKIQILRSVHRLAAIEAIHKTLGKLGMPDRISTVIAQGADELIMNAVFHAPVKADGTPKRDGLNISEDFVLEARERVDLEWRETEEYMGICVTDQFGSFQSDMLMNSLRPIYEKKAKVTQGMKGLGFHKVISSGLSLVMSSHPGTMTRAMIFFPKTNSYKAFKSDFRFLCNLAY